MKKGVLFLVFPILLCYVVLANLPASDDFNRANSQTLGIMSDGNNIWNETASPESVQIVNNMIFINGTGSNYRIFALVNGIIGGNVRINFTYGGWGGSNIHFGGVVLRVNDSNWGTLWDGISVKTAPYFTGYGLLYSGTNSLSIIALSGGSFSASAGISRTLNVGDNLSLEAAGSQLYAYVNNQLVLQYQLTGNYYQIGKIGVFGTESGAIVAGDASLYIDNFNAESIPGECTVNGDCISYSFPSLGMCNNNLKMFNFSSAFTSTCNSGFCLKQSRTWSASCNTTCGAECLTASNCPAVCPTAQCVGSRYSSYKTPNPTCNGCTCQANCVALPGVDNDNDKWDVECGDCDDADGSVNPGSTVSECDGIDHNCDGIVYCYGQPSIVDASWSKDSVVANESVVLLARSLTEAQNFSFDIYRKNNGSCDSSVSSSINVNDPALVSLYHLDANALDSKGNNNGVVSGATSVSGKINNAFNFDGDRDYIQVDDSQSLEMKGNFSVSLWFKSNSSERSNQILLSKGLNYELRYDSIARKISFYIPTSNDVAAHCMWNDWNTIRYYPFLPKQSGDFNEIWSTDESIGVGAADVNDDGYDDAVIISKNGTGVAKLSIYFGKSSGLNRVTSFVDNIEISKTNVSESIDAPVGRIPADLGKAGVFSGDFNGDGYEDIAVSTTNASNSLVYIYYGNATGMVKGWKKSFPFPASCNIISFHSGSLVPTGCYSSLAVGDINKDGYDDLAVGEEGASSNKGSVEIFSGSSSGLATVSSKTISSSQTNCNFGRAVSFGDFNGDGYKDLLIGAPNCNFNGTAYLYSGSSSGLSSGAVWTKNSIPADFPEPSGGPGPQSRAWLFSQGQSVKYGWSVAFGDVDGNGYDDLIVSQLHYFTGICESTDDLGMILIYYASSSGISNDPEMVSYANANTGNDMFPLSIKTQDINGDGRDEILQSSPYTSHFYGGDVDGGTNPVNIFQYNPAVGRVPFPGSCSNTCGVYWKPEHKAYTDGMISNFGDFNGDGTGDLIMTNNYAWHTGFTFGNDNPVDYGETHVFSSTPYDEIETLLPKEDEWHNLVVSYDGTMKIYLDGILKASKAVDANVPQGVSPLMIGAGSEGKNFNGLIDEVGIWNRALTTDEVEQFSSNDIRIGQVNSDLASAGQSEISNSNIQALYNFDYDFNDSSENDNYGNCSGTNCPIINSSGKFFSSAQFDGSNDYLNIPFFDMLNPTGTFSAWINLNDNNSEEIFSIGGASDQTNDAFEFGVKKGKLYSRLNSQGISADRWAFYGNTILLKGNWYHVVLVEDGISPKLYVDGNEETLYYDKLNIPGKFLDSMSRLNKATMGKASGANAGLGYFSGKIDDFAFFNRPLTSTEISDLYNLGRPLSANQTLFIAKTSWVSKYKDEGNCNPPQYYFIASSDGLEEKSNYLNVADYAGSCSDSDGDHYSPEGGNCGLIDCNDLNRLVNPNVQEICNDGIDNNCNGLTDCEDSQCSNSASCPLTIFRNYPEDKIYDNPNVFFSISTSRLASNCVYSFDDFAVNYSFVRNGNNWEDMKYLTNGSYRVDFSCSDSSGSAKRTSFFSVSQEAMCVDADEDGYNVTSNGVSADFCGGIDKIANMDCNDGDNLIHPGANETCNDAITCSQDYDCTGGDVKKDLVAYYSFDNPNPPTPGGSPVIEDLSGYENNGSGGSVYIVPGKVGNSLRFAAHYSTGPGSTNTAGSVRVPYSTDIDLNKEFTVSLWFNLTNDSEDFNLLTKVGNLPYGLGSHIGYKIGVDLGRPYIVLQDGINNFISAKSFFVPKNQWHHLAVTYSDEINTTRFYLDGTLREIDDVNLSLPMAFDGNAMSLGGDPAGDRVLVYVNSSMDELKIWNYELDSQAIQEEYQRGGDVPDTIPPSFTNLANKTLILGQSLNYTIGASDASGISCFKVNDTINFNINCSGFLNNTTAMNLGIRYLNIFVNDTLNNINSGIIWINMTGALVCNETCQNATPQGYVAYQFEHSNFTKIETIFNWSDVPKNNDTSIYPALMRFPFQDGGAGYIGPQYELSNLGTKTVKKVIFSIWSHSTGGVPGLTAHAYSPWCVENIDPGNGENGDFVQCALQSDQPTRFYNWTVGKEYKIKVQKESELSDGAVWNATITDLSNGQETLIGKIKLDNRSAYKGYGLITSRITGFFEYYSGGNNNKCLNAEYGKIIRNGTYAYNYQGKWLAKQGIASNPLCYASNRTSNQPGIIVEEVGNGVVRSIRPTEPAFEDKVLWNLAGDINLGLGATISISTTKNNYSLGEKVYLTP